jgi:hypothetical protein
VPKLTQARRRALETLVSSHPEPCRYSNTTDPDARLVYWQPVDWLYLHGYVTVEQGPKTPADDRKVRLTAEGLTLAVEEGIVTDPDGIMAEPGRKVLAGPVSIDPEDPRVRDRLEQAGVAPEAMLDLAVLEAEDEMRQLAGNLYRLMNESVSEHLAGMHPQQRRAVFLVAEGHLERDLDAKMPVDLARAFTEAIMVIDPAYDDPRFRAGLTDETSTEDLAALRERAADGLYQPQPDREEDR